MKLSKKVDPSANSASIHTPACTLSRGRSAERNESNFSCIETLRRDREQRACRSNAKRGREETEKMKLISSKTKGVKASNR